MGLHSDQGTSFTAQARQQWAHSQGLWLLNTPVQGKQALQHTLGNTEFGCGGSGLGSHVLRLCLQNHNLNMSFFLLLFSHWSVRLWGDLQFCLPLYPRQGPLTLVWM